jgi:phosphopantetheine adenylyltransferase
MGVGFSGESELLARPLKDADACVAALGDEAGEAVVVALAGDEDLIEAAATGLESFRDRMQAVENFHRN